MSGPIDRDMREREQSIIGRPPQIQPLERSEFSEEVRAFSMEMSRSAGLPLDYKQPEYVTTLFRHLGLMQAHWNLTTFLMGKGALTLRDRELAILRTAWLCGSPYAWGQHVAMAKHTTNITSEEIDRVRIGSGATNWNDRDRAIIHAVEEMHEDARISDETWAVLAAHLDEQQLLELPILVGQYHGVAFLLNSIRIRMMEGNEGFSAC